MIQLPVPGKFSLDEVSRCGRERFEKLRRQIEAEHWNRYIAIDVETGDFELADRRGAAWRVLNERYPEGHFYLRKVGADPEPELAARLFGGGSRGGAKAPDQSK